MNSKFYLTIFIITIIITILIRLSTNLQKENHLVFVSKEEETQIFEAMAVVLQVKKEEPSFAEQKKHDDSSNLDSYKNDEKTFENDRSTRMNLDYMVDGLALTDPETGLPNLENQRLQIIMDIERYERTLKDQDITLNSKDKNELIEVLNVKYDELEQIDSDILATE